jgi:uncharacterized protein
MLAVIADSPSLPRAELRAALEFAGRWGFPVRVLATAEMENEAYRRNDARRCFHCKDELFARMEDLRVELGFGRIAYGRNLDDDGEFRPGQQAAAEYGVAAPLAEAGLTKAEVRALAREWGLEVAEKPASACLSSRIEYGRAVTVEALAQVEQGEELLHAMGFRQVRVRHHGELARVEVAKEDLARMMDLGVFARVSAGLRGLGFKFVTLDMEGYRSGSMNDLLPVDVLKAGLRA